MKISNNKFSIDEAISRAKEEAKELELEQRANSLITHLEKKYISKPMQSKWPCAALVWSLLGENAHMAVDRVDDMKETVLDLVVFLSDPEIAKRFEKVRRGYSSESHAVHLRRLITVLDAAKEEEIAAEIAHFELSAFGHTEQQLDNLEGDFESSPK